MNDPLNPACKNGEVFIGGMRGQRGNSVPYSIGAHGNGHERTRRTGPFWPTRQCDAADCTCRRHDAEVHKPHGQATQAFTARQSDPRSTVCVASEGEKHPSSWLFLIASRRQSCSRNWIISFAQAFFSSSLQT